MSTPSHRPEPARRWACSGQVRRLPGGKTPRAGRPLGWMAGCPGMRWWRWRTTGCQARRRCPARPPPPPSLHQAPPPHQAPTTHVAVTAAALGACPAPAAALLQSGAVNSRPDPSPRWMARVEHISAHFSPLSKLKGGIATKRDNSFTTRSHSQRFRVVLLVGSGIGVIAGMAPLCPRGGRVRLWRTAGGGGTWWSRDGTSSGNSMLLRMRAMQPTVPPPAQSSPPDAASYLRPPRAPITPGSSSAAAALPTAPATPRTCPPEGPESHQPATILPRHLVKFRLFDILYVEVFTLYHIDIPQKRIFDSNGFV